MLLREKKTRTYDPNRNLLAETDELGNTITHLYNAANQRLKTIYPDGGVIHYTYTDRGNIETVKDQRNNLMHFDYDEAGRVISETDPLGNITKMEYDPAGNLIRKILPDGEIITYSYDSVNRLIQKKMSEDTCKYIYDGLSRIVYSENNTSSLQFMYDAVSRLIKITTGKDSIESTVKYNYDAAGRRTSMIDITGETRYTYDKNGQIESIIDSQGNRFYFIQDKEGRRKHLTGPENVIRTYLYDNADNLTEIVQRIKGDKIGRFSYRYYLNGNIHEKEDQNGIYYYTYDAVNRLVFAAGEIDEEFTYDRAGNRIGDLKNEFTYNDFNQLADGTSGLIASYDRNGNLKSQTLEGVTWTYGWNSENQLISAVSSEGIRAYYSYDPLGRRISKRIGRLRIYYIYDMNNILLEYKNGMLKGRYTHCTNLNEPLAKTDFSLKRNYFYFADGAGTISSIIDKTGKLLEEYTYSTFGIPAVYTGNEEKTDFSVIGNPYLFAGKEYDLETGLYYLQSGYYDPRTGRFINKNPQRYSGQYDGYSFLNNNPAQVRSPWEINGAKDTIQRSPVEVSPWKPEPVLESAEKLSRL